MRQFPLKKSLVCVQITQLTSPDVDSRCQSNPSSQSLRRGARVSGVVQWAGADRVALAAPPWRTRRSCRRRRTSGNDASAGARPTSDARPTPPRGNCPSYATRRARLRYHRGRDAHTCRTIDDATRRLPTHRRRDAHARRTVGDATRTPTGYAATD